MDLRTQLNRSDKQLLIKKLHSGSVNLFSTAMFLAMILLLLQPFFDSTKYEEEATQLSFWNYTLSFAGIFLSLGIILQLFGFLMFVIEYLGGKMICEINFDGKNVKKHLYKSRNLLVKNGIGILEVSDNEKFVFEDLAIGDTIKVWKSSRGNTLFDLEFIEKNADNQLNRKIIPIEKKDFPKIKAIFWSEALMQEGLIAGILLLVAIFSVTSNWQKSIFIILYILIFIGLTVYFNFKKVLQGNKIEFDGIISAKTNEKFPCLYFGNGQIFVSQAIYNSFDVGNKVKIYKAMNSGFIFDIEKIN